MELLLSIELLCFFVWFMDIWTSAIFKSRTVESSASLFPVFGVSLLLLFDDSEIISDLVVLLSVVMLAFGVDFSGAISSMLDSII